MLLLRIVIIIISSSTDTIVTISIIITITARCDLARHASARGVSSHYRLGYCRRQLPRLHDVAELHFNVEIKHL